MCIGTTHCKKAPRRPQSGGQVCLDFGLFTLGGGKVAFVLFIVLDFLFEE